MKKEKYYLINPDGSKIRLKCPRVFNKPKKNKNNNRRKLKFIREKNNLRLGKRPFTVFAKVTNELLNNPESLKVILKSITNDAIEKVKNKFNLTLKYCLFHTGYNGDDFIKDQQTIKVSLTNKVP